MSPEYHFPHDLDYVETNHLGYHDPMGLINNYITHP
jgi:hypothetical protein